MRYLVIHNVRGTPKAQPCLQQCEPHAVLLYFYASAVRRAASAIRSAARTRGKREADAAVTGSDRLCRHGCHILQRAFYRCAEMTSM